MWYSVRKPTASLIYNLFPIETENSIVLIWVVQCGRIIAQNLDNLSLARMGQVAVPWATLELGFISLVSARSCLAAVPSSSLVLCREVHLLWQWNRLWVQCSHKVSSGNVNLKSRLCIQDHAMSFSSLRYCLVPIQFKAEKSDVRQVYNSGHRPSNGST